MAGKGAGDSSRYEAEIILRDGSAARLRPARPDDREAVEALYARLSERDRRLRFHAAGRGVPESVLSPVLQPDPQTSFALLVVHEGRVIGLAHYRRRDAEPTHADIAFAVEEPHQHLGVATQLLYRLAAAARDHGIEVFEADVLAENAAMLDVLRESGFRLKSSLKSGAYHIAFSVADAPQPRRG